MTAVTGMTYVDSAVLDLTEQMCRRFQAWTGRTNVWLAFQLTNLSIVIYFIWAAGLYFESEDLALRVFVALVCGGVFLVLTRTEFRTFVHPAAAILAPARARGLEPALDTRTRMWRIVGFERARREGVNGGRAPAA